MMPLPQPGPASLTLPADPPLPEPPTPPTPPTSVGTGPQAKVGTAANSAAAITARRLLARRLERGATKGAEGNDMATPFQNHRDRSKSRCVPDVRTTLPTA